MSGELCRTADSVQLVLAESGNCRCETAFLRVEQVGGCWACVGSSMCKIVTLAAMSNLLIKRWTE